MSKFINTWGVLMIEHSAVAAEQEAKSSKNDADFIGNNSAILVFVFCHKQQQKDTGGLSGRQPAGITQLDHEGI